MAWYLVVVYPNGQVNQLTLTDGSRIVIGRSSECTVPISDPEVSRRHCELSSDKHGWHVRDLGSRNGTKRNGVPVQDARLVDGDMLAVGDVHIQLRQTAARNLKSTAPYQPASVPDSSCLDAAGTGAFDLAKPSTPPAKSRLVGRRYELGPLIHAGSTGMFFKARDTKLSGTVCVKILSDAVTKDEAALKRFVRGIRASAELKHPNIVRIYRAGKTSGEWWLAMEYVDGQSLRQLVANYGIGSMLAPARVLRIAHDLTAALEIAFEEHVLHRNIRPDSVLLTKKGRAKLSNFSLARGVVLSTLQRITSSSDMLGDVAFLAPETTEPDGAIDCRSDLYALGACLYSLLTGRPPFTGAGTVELLKNVRTQSPVPPSSYNRAVPRPLEAIVLRLLAKNPIDRFRSPMELREELVRVARYRGM